MEFDYTFELRKTDRYMNHNNGVGHQRKEFIQWFMVLIFGLVLFIWLALVGGGGSKLLILSI